MDNVTANPSIFINPQAPQPQSKASRFNPKIIFFALGLIVVVEIIFGVRTLLQPTNKSGVAAIPKDTSITSSTQAPGGKIILESAKTEYKIGETVTVSIKLDTGGRPTSGTDVVIKFNPNALEASSSSIAQGTIYPDYPLAKVDNELKTIRISGLSSEPNTDYNGVGILATINFKAILSGKTSLIVDFTPGATADSNILETQEGQEWLNEVGNLEVVVK